jgi:hypothetical protein
MADTRADTSRVQRWREEKRKEGLKAVTIWLTTEEELRLKDVALQWHCSPSAVMQRALAQVTMSTPPQNGSAPDTLQMREVIQEELATLQAEVTAMQEALAVIQAEQVSVTDTVTEVVTATLARDLPALVRQLVEGLALEALGLPVTDTDGNDTVTLPEEYVADTGNSIVTEARGRKARGRAPVTDTNGIVTDTEARGEAPPRQPAQRQRGAMRQRILTLLQEHPEGLSAEQIRAYLQPGKPLGDTLQGMRRAHVVTTQGEGEERRYFVA